MTFAARCSSSPEILGVLNATFYPISRNIGGAIAPPAPPVPPPLGRFTLGTLFKCYLIVNILYLIIEADIGLELYPVLPSKKFQSFQ